MTVLVAATCGLYFHALDTVPVVPEFLHENGAATMKA
jgi:hypothetical protein